MAEVAISAAIRLLGAVLIDKITYLTGVEAKVRLVKSELARMQAFLAHANKKQHNDEKVRQWISDLRELALNTQDTIELFVLNVESKRNQGLLKRCTAFPMCVKNLYSIGGEIDCILDELNSLKESRQTYEIKDLGGSSAKVERNRREINKNPVGLDDDVRNLLQGIFYNQTKGLSIAVVEGMGGIGKSTLARKIYNHPIVQGQFNCCAWVVVSKEFTPHETIKQLLNELTPERLKEQLGDEIKKLEDFSKDSLYHLKKLQEMVHERLKARSFFIVLDDIWEEDDWESLKDAFPTSKQGKKNILLITSRNSNMKNYSQYSHKMKRLDSIKSWELMTNMIFVDGNCPQNLEGLVRKIMEKCKGLPLAITIVGGLLAGKDKNTWPHILNQITNSSLKGVSSILELSYQNLSAQLKSCFLCLAFFKENSSISVKRLIHLWIGLGLIHQEGETSVEKIALGYLDELINMNMVEVKDLTLGNRVKNCQVHDLVHKVCLEKGYDEISLEILRETELPSSTTTNDSKKRRHCVAYSNNLECFSSTHNKYLRSLFIVDEYNVVTHNSSYWKSLQLLKILDLGYLRMKYTPRFLGSLVGLKYLRIYSKYPMDLPKWFENLNNLEVLDMGDSYVTLASGLKMKRLRYFSAQIRSRMIRIEEWKNIETLRFIGVNLWMRCSSNLKDNCRIRDFNITLGKRKSYKSIKVQESLEKLKNLEKLNLSWHWNEMPTNLALIIPQVNSLTKLNLTGKMDTFPSASVFPPKLYQLTLSLCQLEEDPMEELGKLPNLVFLKLSTESYIKETMKVLHGSFPSLEALSLYDIRRLEVIDIEQGGMKYLKHLQIHQCNKFNTNNLPNHITISTIRNNNNVHEPSQPREEAEEEENGSVSESSKENVPISQRHIRKLADKGKTKIIYRSLVKEEGTEEIEESSSSTESVNVFHNTPIEKLLASAQYIIDPNNVGAPIHNAYRARKAIPRKSTRGASSVSTQSPLTRYQASVEILNKKNAEIASQVVKCRASKEKNDVPKKFHECVSGHSNIQPDIINQEGITPSAIFRSLFHASLWEKMMKKKVVYEIKVEARVLMESEIYTLIEAVGLLKSVTGVTNYVPLVVREFYCNLTRDMDDTASDNYHKVFVRGEMLDFSPKIINEHIGSSVKGEMEEVQDLRVIVAELTGGDLASWPTNSETIPSGKLTMLYHALFCIAVHNWVPTTHRSTVNQTQGRFLFHVGTGRKFNFGKFVFQKVVSLAENEIINVPIVYPILISEIIKKQKQNMTTRIDYVNKNKFIPKNVSFDPKTSSISRLTTANDQASKYSTPILTERQRIMKFLEESVAFHSRKIFEHEELKKIHEIIGELVSTTIPVEDPLKTLAEEVFKDSAKAQGSRRRRKDCEETEAISNSEEDEPQSEHDEFESAQEEMKHSARDDFYF